MANPELIEQLKQKLPEKFHPWADKYLPALAGMAEEELVEWVHLLAKGDIYSAYKQLLDKLPGGQLEVEGQEILSAWQDANIENARKIDLQKKALYAILGILLEMAIAGGLL